VDFRIQDRIALVVGGSKGMGLEVAKMLAAESCRVAIVARTQRHIESAVAHITDNGGKAIGVAADMSTEAGINEAVAAVTEQLGHEGLTTDEQRRSFLMRRAGIPAARLGQPEEIASTIAYLCSDQAGYLTGHYITVDGGLHRSAF